MKLLKGITNVKIYINEENFVKESELQTNVNLLLKQTKSK